MSWKFRLCGLEVHTQNFLKGPSVTELTVVSALGHMHRGTVGEVGIIGGDGPGLQLTSTCIHTTSSMTACMSVYELA
jgi:hypothetical protein